VSLPWCWSWGSVKEYYGKSRCVEDNRDPAREAHPAPPRCEGDALDTTSGELQLSQQGQVHMSPNITAAMKDAEGGEGLCPAARSA
jgi:hypothetical protein